MAISSKYSKWDTEYLVFNLMHEQHTFIKNRLRNIAAVTLGLKEASCPDFEALNEFRNRLDLFLLILQLHVMKEESSLYPDILRLSTIITLPEEFPDYKEKFIGYQVRDLKAEHRRFRNDLHYFKTEIIKFTPPQNASNLFSYLSDQFNELESILCLHLNIEDRILYPRAIKLESDMNDQVEYIRNNKLHF